MPLILLSCPPCYNFYYKHYSKHQFPEYLYHNLLSAQPQAETCEYSDLTSELLRDRLVVGIQDSLLSECLELDPSLTLEKAKKVEYQTEAVQEHQIVLKQAGSADKFSVVEQIRHTTHKNPPSEV